MEGVRFKTMARLLILVWAIVACCEAHFGHHRNIFINRSPDLRAFRPVEDHKCFGLARRTFLFNHIISVPCSSVTPQMSVMAVVPSPNGNICRGQVKMPQTKYYRVQQCCTGWTMDKLGMCRIPKGPMPGHEDLHSDSPSHPMVVSLQRMSPFAPNPGMLSQMRNMIAIKRIQMNPMAQVNRPPMSPISPVMAKLQKLAQITGMQLPSLQQKIIEIARNPALQEKLRNLVQIQEHKSKETPAPPHSRNIKIVHTTTPRPASSQEQVLRQHMSVPPRQLHRMLLMIPGRIQRMMNMMRGHPMMPTKMGMMMSGRMPFPPGRMGMMPRHPMMHARMMHMMPDGPRIQRIDTSEQMSQDVPQQGHDTVMPDTHEGCMDPTHGHAIDTLPEGDVAAMAQDAVSLPMSPINMPEIHVQPGPNFQMESPPMPVNCMRTFTETIGRCFGQANVPPPPPAETFSFDVTSPLVQELCSKQEQIIRCIVDGQGSCDTRQEAFLVRRSVRAVATNLEKICSQLNDMPNEEPISTPMDNPAAEEVKSNIISSETAALDTENQRVPTEEILQEETDVKAEAVVAVDKKPLHEVHVEEIEKVEEYYLPLLIGTTIGFVALLIMLSALVCLCCRRRYKRKLTITKEMEKPKLFDGIYTIGVPPPVYEVAGIPQLSYEEAKGEMVGVHRPKELKNTADEDGE